MRILFVSNTNSLYGANRSMLELIKYLKAMGDDVIVLLPRGNGITDELEKVGCEYYVEKYRNCVKIGRSNALGYFTNIIAYFKLLHKIRNWNIDIIHSNTSVLDIGACIAYSLKIPHVWHIRELLEHYHMKWVIPFFYKRLREKSDGTIYISHFLLEQGQKVYVEKNARVIYNGFDISVDTANRENRINDKVSVNLLVCGMITVSKGQAEAIEATRILHKRKINANLFLAGEAGDERYADALKQKIQEYDMEDYVHFLGFQKDLSQIRQKADIVLQCSKLEGMGRVTVESMLAGIIVVGAASGATNELITDGENGYLYENGNYTELADKIEYIVMHPEQKRQIESRAKEEAQRKFDAVYTNERIRRMYEELVHEKDI